MIDAGLQFRRRAVASFFLFVVLATIAGCGVSPMELAGTVTFKDQPVYGGTIHFESLATGENGRRVSAGCSLDGGKFSIPSKHGLAPGKYHVTIVAVQKTGRKVTMPMRGELDEVEEIPAQDLQQDIEITKENANKLTIALTAK